jgi:hypothetical protein
MPDDIYQQHELNRSPVKYQGWKKLKMNVSNGIELYNSVYPTSRDNRKNIIDEVIDKIKADDILLLISDEELYLVIDEALTNAMEHGNRWDAGKRVKVKVYRRRGERVRYKKYIIRQFKR